jgi:hypothetical protein
VSLLPERRSIKAREYSDSQAARVSKPFILRVHEQSFYLDTEGCGGLGDDKRKTVTR